MSHVVIVTTGQDGKISLSKDELQKMLDDAYQHGYSDGKSTATITYPSYPAYWYSTTYGNRTIDADKITISST
jgi:hypothetical protein